MSEYYSVSYGFNDELSKLLNALSKPAGIQDTALDEFDTVKITFRTGSKPIVVFIRPDGGRRVLVAQPLEIISIREAFSLPPAAKKIKIVFRRGEFTKYNYEFVADVNCLDKLTTTIEESNAHEQGSGINIRETGTIRDLISGISGSIEWIHVPPEWGETQ